MKDALEEILELFRCAENLKDKYACIQDRADRNSPSDATEMVVLAAAMQSQLTCGTSKKHNQPGVKKRMRWAVHDRKKFILFVTEIQDLVRSVREITRELASIYVQESHIITTFEHIKDIDTLEVISEACEDTDTAIYRAASECSQLISVGTTARFVLEHWSVDEGAAGDTTVDPTRLEDLDVMELKQLLIRKSRELEELQANHTGFLAPTDLDDSVFCPDGTCADRPPSCATGHNHPVSESAFEATEDESGQSLNTMDSNSAESIPAATWQKLYPVIHRLYIHERRPVADVRRMMKSKYLLDAR